MTPTETRPKDHEAKREAEDRNLELNARMRAIKAEIGKIRAGARVVHACW